MKYFAGANTRNGFLSIFDDIFADSKRIFILKGSSGCGKSTLMKRVYGTAVKKGYSPDLIYCSADPQSLDGVIIPEIGIAIADGTSPHIMDVKYPCVRETIINLGQFWDESKLLPHRDEIISLTDRKSKHYKNAYRCLAAAGSTMDVYNNMISKSINLEKLDKAAFELTDRFNKTKNGNLKKIFASSFSSKGFTVLEVFENADTVYRLKGKAGKTILSAMEKILIEQNADVIIGYSPIDPRNPELIYFPQEKAIVTILNQPLASNTENEKEISLSRFCDLQKLSPYKMRMKALEKLEKEILADCISELTTAKDIHDQLESIYIPAMDFVRLDDYTIKLMKDIFQS